MQAGGPLQDLQLHVLYPNGHTSAEIKISHVYSESSVKVQVRMLESGPISYAEGFQDNMQIGITLLVPFLKQVVTRLAEQKVPQNQSTKKRKVESAIENEQYEDEFATLSAEYSGTIFKWKHVSLNQCEEI